jgi:hypothetical protein
MTEKEIKEAIFTRLLAFGKQNRGEVRAHINNMLDQALPLTDREFRAIITEMISEGYPVGSSPVSGYFIVNSQELFDEATASLKAKIGGLARRIQNLKQATEHRFNINIQLELFDRAI